MSKTKPSLTLYTAWRKFDKLYLQGRKYKEKSYKLGDGSGHSAAELNTFAKGELLQAEGLRIWTETVLAELGNVSIGWVCKENGKWYCILDDRWTFESKR